MCEYIVTMTTKQCANRWNLCKYKMWKRLVAITTKVCFHKDHVLCMILIGTYIKKKFWKELITYFPLIRHSQHRKRVQQFLYYCVCILLCYKYLPSRCLATIEGYTHRNTDWREGFIKYAIEMGSNAMVYIQSFIKIGSGIQTLIERDTKT
jgi:hypothetical protein